MLNTGGNSHCSRWLLALLIILTSVHAVSAAGRQREVQWAAGDWTVSAPEEQGVDSFRLASMLAYVRSRDVPIHSLLVLRNGILILEAYQYPHTADTLHELKSCTKSFISALVGVAIDQGLIPGIDRRVVECFPDRTIANLSETKQRMTLAHLLTMSGGFDWPGGILEGQNLTEMMATQDWIGFVLDRPLSDPPGSRFVYNSGGSHLLSAVLQGAVGTTTEAFAEANLFRPLGIQRWYWNVDPQGISTGGWGLWLKPRDLARFGTLYLNGGRWNDRQVVPAAWVADSLNRQIAAGPSWLSDGYGYQWWIDNRGYSMALGYGGQYIVVVPGRNLVMVVTSGLRGEDFFLPEELLNYFILPASESDTPLPANPAGFAALKEQVDTLADPGRPLPVPRLPATALRISNSVYEMVPSPVGWTRIELVFREGQSSALFVADGMTYQVGLDGLFRFTDPPATLPAPKDAARMIRGAWVDAGTFVMDFRIVGRVSSYIETLQFQNDRLTLREDYYVSGEQYVTTGFAALRKNYRRKNR